MDCSQPYPNTDISGIGVRVSFYLQAVLLALLSVRSPSAEGTTNALATLIITNLAYVVTTLSLGFKPNPGLSLYDALIVCYLLSISWVAIFFALPQYNRFKHASPLLKFLAIAQSYFIIAFGFAILAAAPSFGSDPSCNEDVFISLFAPVRLFNKARIAALVLLSLVTLFQTVLLLNDYREGQPARTGGHSKDGSGDVESGHCVQMSSSRSRPDAETRPRSSSHGSTTTTDPQRMPVKFDGRIVVNILLILVFSSGCIFNTERLRTYNNVQTGDNVWGFGQILPMFLTFLPLASTIQVFLEQGLSPRPRYRKKKKRKTTLSTLSPVGTVDTRNSS